MKSSSDLKCIVCGLTGPDGFAVRFEKPGFEVWECRGCGFLFIPSRFRQSVDYTRYKSRDVSERVAQGDLWIKKQRNLLRYRVIGKTHASGPVLDVGCGFGHFLLTGKELGYDVRGVEMCRENAEFVKNRFGIPVWQGDFLDYPETEFFDVITLWDALEHIQNADRVVSKASRLLKGGGLLVVQVPQAGSLIAKMLGSRWWAMGPDHANYFSKRTVRLLLEKNGLEVRRVRSSVELKNILVYVLLPRLRRLTGKKKMGTAERQEAFNRMTNQPHIMKKLLVRIHNAVYGTMSFLHIGDEMVVTATKISNSKDQNAK
jgi:2-polyprenyl-3-methyl-5-hydroxy-6-metoxy-1,4-benzoquinol methylase